VAIALKLARALETTVEDLFSLPEDAHAPDPRAEQVALLPDSLVPQAGQAVQLCRVDKHIVASVPSPIQCLNAPFAEALAIQTQDFRPRIAPISTRAQERAPGSAACASSGTAVQLGGLSDAGSDARYPHRGGRGHDRVPCGACGRDVLKSDALPITLWPRTRNPSPCREPRSKGNTPRNAGSAGND
jgi:hypothetical protein